MSNLPQLGNAPQIKEYVLLRKRYKDYGVPTAHRMAKIVKSVRMIKIGIVVESLNFYYPRSFL